MLMTDNHSNAELLNEYLLVIMVLLRNSGRYHVAVKLWALHL